MKKSFVVGITGILGSGKTTVSEIIKRNGFKVVSCDGIVDKLLTEMKVIEKLKKILGNEIIIKDKINRKKVREIIFSDENKKREVESLLHPMVFKKIKKEILDIRKNGGIIFVEIPLLFETKSEKLFDKIVVVSAPLKEIKKRLRNKYSEEEIEKIWKNQLSLSYKKKKADYIVDNSGPIFKTEKIVVKILNKLMKDFNFFVDKKGEENGRN
ncbi:MAG: dephospho-CoA kinase [Candidatus Ratteibacteria bacterium]